MQHSLLATILLYPFSLLYGAIMLVRNWLYDKKICATYLPPKATVIVGNLSTGGTGKSPHIAWLISQLTEEYAITTLSRGYKRQTRGFIIADKNQSNAAQIGDEPMEFLERFQNIHVTVGEKRVPAVQKILASLPNTALILLDDAYQHRAINAHLTILLTTYQQPFYKDHILPSGNLREPKCGKKRANYIIVTKCPPTLTAAEKQTIIRKIQPLNTQKVRFSTFEYLPLKDIFTNETITISDKKIVAITGIANNSALMQHLKQLPTPVVLKSLNDHQEYTEALIKELLHAYPASEYQIVITSKDAVKWKTFAHLLQDRQIAVQEIAVAFLDEPNTLLQDIRDIIAQHSKTKN